MWFDISCLCLIIISHQFPSVSLIDISVENMPSDNALHTAAREGNVAGVQAQVGKFDINAKGEHDMTALNWAAAYGKTEVVKLLLTHNADVNLANVSIPTMISVHLSVFSHPIYLHVILFSTPLGMYCYHV